MRRWPLVVLLLVIALVGGRFIFMALSRTDDRTLIKEALAEAVKASREGRPGSVIDLLASNFKVNGENASVGQVADFVKKNHPDVSIKNTEPTISGETAEITSDVDVAVNFMGARSYTFRNARIQLRKETVMDWLVFPTSKWHLSAVHVDEADLPSLALPWS